MERREHLVPPGEIVFEMTDDTGHTIIVSAEQAYELFNWLYDRRKELHQVAMCDNEPMTDRQSAQEGSSAEKQSGRRKWA